MKSEPPFKTRKKQKIPRDPQFESGCRDSSRNGWEDRASTRGVASPLIFIKNGKPERKNPETEKGGDKQGDKRKKQGIQNTEKPAGKMVL